MLASTQMYGCITPNLTSKGAGKLVTEMRDVGYTRPSLNSDNFG